MYVFLSSNDPSPFTQNNNKRFKVKLSERINLQGNWECAITEARVLLPVTVDYVDVHLNICSESFVGHTKSSILRRIFRVDGSETGLSEQYLKPYYIPLKINSFDLIEVNLVPPAENRFPVQHLVDTNIVLHFKQE